MNIFQKMKYRHLKKRVQRMGIPLCGRVEQINTSHAVPLVYARDHGLPKMVPHIIVSYRTPDGKDQILSMHTPDVAEFEPVGRDIPLRYLNDNGRDIAFPAYMFREEEDT